MTATASTGPSGRGPSVFQVAPDVVGVRTWIVNAYLVSLAAESGEGWVLIDAGLAPARQALIRAAERQFGRIAPAAILLTHAHFDHIGAVQAVLTRWPHVPVLVHPLERPYVTGQLPYPPPDPQVGGGLMARLAPLFPKRPADFGAAVRHLPEDGSVPFLPGWRWIHTPGHTPGHVSFFRAHDHVLLTGDAFVTVRQESLAAVWRQSRELRPPPAYFTVDWKVAFESMRSLAALDPRVAATGHGRPMREPALGDQLAALLAQFERRGLPRAGRYVRASWGPLEHRQTAPTG